MAKQQSEYDKIVQNGPELRVAFQDHLVGLCEILLGVHLITSDNVSVVMNEATGLPARASKLLELIRNKVQPNSENYYVFVKAIQKDKKGRFRQEYRDILDILGEECPKPQSQLTTSPPARPRTPTLLHFVESDVIQDHCADLTLAISASDSNIDMFGMYLVQCRCCTREAVTSIKSTLGISSFEKASRLITLVDSRIKSSGSKENARKIFDCLMFVLEYKLTRCDTAEALAATFRSRDHTYEKPPPSYFDDPKHCLSGKEETGQNENSTIVTGSMNKADSLLSGQDPKDTSKTSDKQEEAALSEGHNIAGTTEQAQSTGPSAFQALQATSPPKPTKPAQETALSEDNSHDNHVQATAPPADTSPVNVTQEAVQPEDQNDSSNMPADDESPGSADSKQDRTESDSASRPDPEVESSIVFSKSMSIPRFIEYLKDGGLCDIDCQKIIDNGFTAKGFAADFTEDDIKCPDMAFTKGGKRVLKRLHKEATKRPVHGHRT